jgi:predicted metalloprotease with PDZ domain
MKNNLPTANFFLLYGLFFISFICSANAQTDVFSYKIKPVPQADRTNLEISLQFQAADNKSLTVKMPSDCFGTPDLYKYVTRFEGENGTIVTAREKQSERIVQPAADGKVSLRYTLSFDPNEMDKFPYAPNTGADYFHAAGCQYLLPVGEETVKRRFQIEMTDVPHDWQIYATSSANASKFEIESSFEDWQSAAIGGGKNVHTFQTKKARVAVYTHGDFQIPRERIFSSIEQIVRLERAWFDDYAQPVYTIVVAPRSRVTAGYAPENAFICFVDRETRQEDLNLLVAHEFFHNWLPNKIEIVQDKRSADFRFEWFSEGFTDYFAQKILADSKLLAPEKFVESVNRNIYNIADNPHRNKTYDELLALGKVGKFDGTAKKLAYFRGALIALNWEAQIKGGKKGNLSDFIRALYKRASKTGGKISEQEFYEFARKFGIDARADFEKYIMRGETIVPETNALGKNYELHEAEKPAFDIGFLLEETQKTRKISGVKESSSAYRAGLRDGMDFVGVENAYRFSNAWKADKPLVVKVKIDGTERRFEYFPHGEPMKLWLFSAAKIQ